MAAHLFKTLFPIFGNRRMKLFKELRISFIVLNRDRYENVFLHEVENGDAFFINNTVKDMFRSLAVDDAAYERFQNYYFNSLDYASWVTMKKEYVRDILNRLNNDRIVHSDDLQSFRQYLLFYSALEYFQTSWYCLPSLEFSQDFYKNVLPAYFQCLLNHESGPARYQYNLERISLNDPTTKSSDVPHGQRYYLLNEKLIDDLIKAMHIVNQQTLSEVVAYEYSLMLDALQKAKKLNVYIVLTSF